MGIEIGLKEKRTAKLKYPLGCYLKFTCDSHNHRGFVKTTVSQRWDLNGYIANYSAAMKAGWKDTFRNGRRVFFCPNCSGKK